MTRVTKNSLKSHDLRSPAIMERLTLGDHLLIDEIASVLYSKVLDVIEADIPTINDWEKRDEKLKWVLHSQVEILGQLRVCEKATGALVHAKNDKICDLLRELIYGYHFLSQEISALFYELQYSTWNLLDFLDPRHYDTRAVSSAPLDQLLLVQLQEGLAPQTTSLSSVWDRLSTGPDVEGIVELVKIQMEEWLLWCGRYQVLIRYFYETASSKEALSAFNHTFAIAVRLLGVSLSLKLSVELLSNSVKG